MKYLPVSHKKQLRIGFPGLLKATVGTVVAAEASGAVVVEPVPVPVLV